MAKKAETFSILDKGVVFDGTLTGKGKLLIKGTVKGTLEGEHVTIGEEGTVQAETTVGHLTIGGKFEGTVEASGRVVILSTGSCEGKVICQDLVVEPGGILNAQVTRSVNPEAPPPPEPRARGFGPFRREKRKKKKP